MKLLHSIAISCSLIATVGCSVSNEGDVWVTGQYTPNGQPGYDSTPAVITLHQQSAYLEDCNGQVTSLDGEVVGSYIVSTDRTDVEVSLPDQVLSFNTICTDIEGGDVLLKTYVPHIQGVDQNADISALNHLVSAYYDFFASVGDVTGSEEVYVGLAKNSVYNFFIVDHLYRDYANHEYPVSVLSDDYYIQMVSDAIYKIGIDASESQQFNLNQFLLAMSSDLTGDGKLDGLAITESGVIDLYISDGQAINSYTYLNEISKVAAQLSAENISDLNVMTAVYNHFESVSIQREALSRNIDIQQFDLEPPLFDVVYNLLGTSLSLLVGTNDDVIAKDVKLIVGQTVIDIPKQEGSDYYSEILFDDYGLVRDDFSNVVIQVSDFAGNFATENHDLTM